MTLIFEPEAPRHAAVIDALLQAAFDADWPARPASRLRAGVAPVAALCRVALLPEHGLVGVIRHYPVRLGALPGLLLGPVAVAPARRGQGIARALIRVSLALARGQGWQRVALVGDPAYYARLGFEAAAPHRLRLPGTEARLMVQALRPNGLDGIAGLLDADRRRVRRAA